VHCELLAVVHVVGEMHPITSEHCVQMVFGPTWSGSKPDWQSEHVESPAVVQVTGATQWSTAVHVGHVSATPSETYRPAAHWVHCEVAALVQVIGEIHPSIPLQGEQVSLGPVSFR
jgi:hypothetical protein